eukprot:Skav230916  [mRNA]  locus=scaffold2578:72148:72573:- [translate_table: standard]
MRRDEISENLRPSVQQIKNYRHQNSCNERPAAYSVECLGELRAFIDAPPTDVEILTEHVILSEDRVWVPFCVDGQPVDEMWQQASLHVGLMDFTFKTNKEGLLLGCCGPGGLRVIPGKPPSMRVMPRFFLLQRMRRRSSCY